MSRSSFASTRNTQTPRPVMEQPFSFSKKCTEWWQRSNSRTYITLLTSHKRHRGPSFFLVFSKRIGLTGGREGGKRRGRREGGGAYAYALPQSLLPLLSEVLNLPRGRNFSWLHRGLSVVKHSTYSWYTGVIGQHQSANSVRSLYIWRFSWEGNLYITKITQ